MDTYEQQQIELIKKLSQGLDVDRGELGRLRLKRFAAMLYILLAENGEHFDVLVSGGNSGAASIEIAKMVYKAVGKEVPPTVLLPIYRPSNEADVTVNPELVREQLKDIHYVERVLFVDDEIMRGQTAKACFESIRDSLGNTKVAPFMSCTIVAENHFFIWKYDLKGIAVRFLPFAFVMQGYNGNFGYLIPAKAIEKLEPVLGAPIDRNKALALLLSGKVKTIKDQISYYDTALEDDIKNKIPEYMELKSDTNKYFNSLVTQGIEEYQNKEIAFKYLA